MNDRSDDILPHLFLNNKRLFVLRKAWLFTGNNTADDSSWQLGDDLSTQQRKHPTVHKNTTQVRTSTPPCIQDEQLLLLSPCYYYKHFRHAPETSGILCSSSTTHKTLCFIQTTGQVSTASPLAADSSWLLLHWLGQGKFLKQSYQVFYIQSRGQHGKNKVGSSSHSSGLHTVATSFGNLVPIIDAELSYKPGP